MVDFKPLRHPGARVMGERVLLGTESRNRTRCSGPRVVFYVSGSAWSRSPRGWAPSWVQRFGTAGGLPDPNVGQCASAALLQEVRLGQGWDVPQAEG